jgi:hypothetical protein
MTDEPFERCAGATESLEVHAYLFSKDNFASDRRSRAETLVSIDWRTRICNVQSLLCTPQRQQ